MKILVITDKLYPDECGGSCIVAFETLNVWQKTEKVDIFTLNKTKTSNDSLFKGNVYRDFNKKKIFSSSKKLARILKNNKYDIVVLHSPLSWLVYYYAKKKAKMDPKTVMVWHGPWHKEAIYKYEGQNKKIKKLILPKIMHSIEKKCVKDNKNFIFLSNYMKDEISLINKSLLDKNITIIPGGVNLSKYVREYEKEKAKKLLNISKEKCVIFILRRIDKRMGIDDAIRAFSLLNNKDDYEFVVGGKGKYLPTLEKIAEENNIKVRFEGYIPDDKINLYFCAADLFLVPTKDLEGFGLVNVESLAMGVPVIARPQGGMNDLDRLFDNFIKIKDMSIESMAKTIDVNKDRFLNKVIKEKNINNYDWKVISLKYLDLFKEIIK